MSSKSTERVRRFRERAREDGWATVAVKVPAHRVEELRAFAESLGAPTPKTQEGQASLFPDLPQG